MSRLAIWLIVVAAALAALVVAALLAVPYLVDTPRVQAYIANAASQALGRPVKFRSMSVRVLPLPAVELHDLEIAEDPHFGREPFLRLDSGRVHLRLGPLLTGHVDLGDVTLSKPLITVIQTVDGRMNISTLGTGGTAASTTRGGSRGGPSRGGGTATALAGSRISIERGVVTYISEGRAQTRYRIADLDLTVTGGASEIDVKADAKLAPGDLSLKLTDGVVAGAPGKTLSDAALRGKLGVVGKDIGELTKAAAGPSPALGGSINGTLTLGGTVALPTATGEVALSNVTVTQVNPQCPEPKRRTLALPVIKLNAAYQDQRLAARPLTTSIGTGTITSQLLVTLARGTRVQMNDLSIKALPLEKVLVDFLCEGYAITGPLDLTGSVAFSPTDIWRTLSGPGQLRIGPGRVVGARALALLGSVVRVGGAVSQLLNADVPALQSGSPLEYDSITGQYTITDGVFATKDLLYTSRVMKIAMAGTYGLATGRMDLDMTVSSGRTAVAAKVTGSASSPSVRVDPASVLRDLDSKKVEKDLGELLKRLR